MSEIAKTSQNERHLVAQRKGKSDWYLTYRSCTAFR
jgi:hypothetical protein